MTKRHDPDTITTYCPSCGKLRRFVCIGYNDGNTRGGLFTWLCSQGHKLDGSNIGKSKPDFEKGENK